ncbi:hypothetical protein OUZ56_001886 [Daphnia magna]|uniref:Uncharacterized protein n=1 Tax=Daphnia magna TaxID=35525 RepID=A0ABR0A4E8_9CRUS|nr:hypothetical protein OUZ56_001886 [Daphnia magna]
MPEIGIQLSEISKIQAETLDGVDIFLQKIYDCFSSPSSSINNRVFFFVFLSISPQHPRYPDFQVSLISQPSSIPFSSSLWLLFIPS